MKKVLVVVLCLIMCFAFTACGSKEAADKEYTYKVRAMQGVDSCVYYGPDAEIPNSPDPEAARNKIHVWTKCPTCGDNGQQYHFKFAVDKLDFSDGDTIQKNGTDVCWDCKWNGGNENFMWVVEITRVEQK